MIDAIPNMPQWVEEPPIPAVNRRLDELGRLVETQAKQIRWLEGENAYKTAELHTMRGALDLYARTAAAMGTGGRQSVMERVRADSAMLAARGDMSDAEVRGRLTPCPWAADGLEAIGGGGNDIGGCDGTQ